MTTPTAPDVSEDREGAKDHVESLRKRIAEYVLTSNSNSFTVKSLADSLQRAGAEYEALDSYESYRTTQIERGESFDVRNYLLRNLLNLDTERPHESEGRIQAYYTIFRKLRELPPSPPADEHTGWPRGLRVTLTGTSNPYLVDRLPLRGEIQVNETRIDGSAVSSSMTFRLLNEETGKLGAPVVVRDASFTYEGA